MTQPIEFITAEEGKIVLFIKDARRTSVPVCRSADVNELAAVLRKHGMDAYHSSSMDFAAEYGFATNDEAHDILDAAVQQVWG